MPTRTKTKKVPALRFDQKLVLNQWLLSVFGEQTLEHLSDNLKAPEYEGFDENNVHRFHHQLKLLWERPELPDDILLGYDQNIVKHTLELSRKRSNPLRWKYFQYLSLLFTEIYLDRYFRNPSKLLDDLNHHLRSFNLEKPKKEQLPEYVASDLQKIAFWNATGSGKTLLMHVNIKQYQHYLKVHGKGKKLNRIILLTPNEGLSKQHLQEFKSAGIQADLFFKDAPSVFSGKTVEIIDVHKLKDTMGQKTVAIDAFEGNNLVLVDEGHRGASSGRSGAWMDARNRLCEDGFSFEYSATFGQAVKGKKLELQYAKNILFDYSYKYFYKDGFGKDYRILNLADDSDEYTRRLYLTACLVAFYQQLRLYEEQANDFRPYLLEKPLWVFVGGSVNAVRRENKKDVSDVLSILLVLADFVQDKRESIDILDRLLGGRPGLLDQRGNELFATAFSYLATSRLSAEEIFSDILLTLFNSGTQAALHVEQLKGTDGEIALRLGENEPFGLINVGDASKLRKLCEEHSTLVVTEKEFAGSLFQDINNGSTINVLIGSKKFTEGWNSWRVSTMGLMNIGRTEGSEIIQLFGRGVRLKGRDLSLKRSSHLKGAVPPQHIQLLETLNVFGVRADYMRQFKDYLEEEGVTDPGDQLEFVLPVVNGLNGKKLMAVRLQGGRNFKRQGEKPILGKPPEKLVKHPVTLDWYPKIQSQQSKGVKRTTDTAVKQEGVLRSEHLAFMDLNTIWFELQRFKNERSWHNLNLPLDCIESLLLDSTWYRLFIPPEELEFRSFEQVYRWQEISIALLRKYVDRYYKFKQQEWESEFYEYHILDEEDPNFLKEYKLQIEASQDTIIEKLKELEEALTSGAFQGWSFGNLEALCFDRHLYQPLLHCTSDLITVSPVSLNQGEKQFVLDVKAFCDINSAFFDDRELYLLRNRSRGNGIGFFEAGNFYPDFLLWLIDDNHQYVNFIDPKGLWHLDGLSDPKIQFNRTIKELEQRLGDPLVTLNSFIVSVTPFERIKWWTMDHDRSVLEEANVFFQPDDDNYVSQIIDKILR